VSLCGFHQILSVDVSMVAARPQGPYSVSVDELPGDLWGTLKKRCCFPEAQPPTCLITWHRKSSG